MKGKNQKDCQCRGKLTRRGFLQLVGAGAMASAAAGKGAAQPPPNTPDSYEKTRVTLLVNGRRRRVLVEPRWSLLFVLREKFGLTGTKVGCESALR